MLPMPWNDQIKRRLKLRDLDALIAIVAAGGMGKAADKLNVSQPAISKQSPISSTLSGYVCSIVHAGASSRLPTGWR